MHTKVLGAALVVTLSTFACGKKKEDDKYGKASVAMGNASTAALADAKPSAFGVKLKTILMVSDRVGSPTAENNFSGTNSGQAAMLWGAPKCATTTTDATNGAVVGELKSDTDCAAAGLDYFDLNRASTTVNTDLNSQEAKVLPGTYRYIGLSLLGEQAGANNTHTNTKWAHSGSDVTEQTFASVQTEWWSKFEPALELGEEQTVVVTLAYNLDAAVTTGLTAATEKVTGNGTDQGSAYDDCNAALSVCFKFPKLTVTVTKK